MIYRLHERSNFSMAIVMSLCITNLFLGLLLVVEPQLPGRQPIFVEGGDFTSVDLQLTGNVDYKKVNTLRSDIFSAFEELQSMISGQIVFIEGWGETVDVNGTLYQVFFTEQSPLLFKSFESSNPKEVAVLDEGAHIRGEFNISTDRWFLQIDTVARTTSENLTTIGELVLNIMGFRNIIFLDNELFSDVVSQLKTTGEDHSLKYSYFVLMSYVARREVLWKYEANDGWKNFTKKVGSLSRNLGVRVDITEKFQEIEKQNLPLKLEYYFIRGVFAFITLLSTFMILNISINKRRKELYNTDRLLINFGMTKKRILMLHLVDHIFIFSLSVPVGGALFVIFAGSLGYGWDVSGLFQPNLLWAYLLLIHLLFIFSYLKHYQLAMTTDMENQNTNIDVGHILQSSLLFAAGFFLLFGFFFNPGGILIGFYTLFMYLLLILPTIGEKLGMHRIVISNVAVKKWKRGFVRSIRKSLLPNYRPIFTLIFFLTFVSLITIGSIISFQYSISYSNSFDNAGEVSFQEVETVNGTLMSELATDNRIDSYAYYTKLQYREDFTGYVPRSYTILGISNNSRRHFEQYARYIDVNLDRIYQQLTAHKIFISNDLKVPTEVSVEQNFSINFLGENETVKKQEYTVAGTLSKFPGVALHSLDRFNLYPTAKRSFIIMSYEDAVYLLKNLIRKNVVTTYVINVKDNSQVNSLVEDLQERYGVPATSHFEGEGFVEHWIFRPTRLLVFILIINLILVFSANTKLQQEFMESLSSLMFDHGLENDYRKLAHKLYRAEFIVLFCFGFLIHTVLSMPLYLWVFVFNFELLLELLPMYATVSITLVVTYLIIHRQFNQTLRFPEGG